MRLPFLAPLSGFAACAAAQVPAQMSHLVISERSPSLTLNVSRDFTPLPPLNFPIENLTHAQRRIFVDAGPDRSIRRMVVVQFERVQEGSDFRFVYPSRPPRRFGASTYRANASAFDDAREAAADPGRESGQTRRFLSSLGYRLPQSWKVARLARVTDRRGLSEVILFYLEPADVDFPQGLSADGSELSPQESARLFRELEASIGIVSG